MRQKALTKFNIMTVLEDIHPTIKQQNRRKNDPHNNQRISWFSAAKHKWNNILKNN